jgi:predicted Fe-Mo cluster-binding NifX family protein
MEGREVRAVQAIANPYFTRHQPGQVPGFINQQQADVMLTGGMGHRAIAFFQQFDIQPVTGAHGTVRLALEQYLGGDLQGAAPCRESIAHDCGEIPPKGEYEKDEVGRLREEVDMLRQQLDEAETRLSQLDQGIE